MSVDLDTNSEAIHAAINNVRDVKHPSTWCILGFDKTKRTIKVADRAEEEGEDDDLDELESAFNDSKCQFGFVSTIDPNTGLNKEIFISWCGEAVAPMDKSRFPSQAEAIQRRFPGSHVVVEARDARDLKKSDLKKKVSKSSGANYSIHNEKADPRGYAPEKVHGSGYEKPAVAWDKSQAQVASYEPATSSPRGYQKAEIIAGNASSFRDRFEPSSQAQREEETRLRLAAEREERRQKEDAARATIQQDAGSTQAVSKSQRRMSQVAREEAQSGSSGMSMPPRMGGGGGSVVMPPPPKGSSFGGTAAISVSGTMAREEAPQQPAWGEEPAAAAPPPPTHYAAPPPPTHYSEPTPEESEYSLPQTENTYAMPDPETRYEEPHHNNEPQEQHYDLPDHPNEPQQLPPQPPEELYAEPDVLPQEGVQDWGVCATTIYDYQAQGDDEISFDVGEVITNIDKVDEGWWVGDNVNDQRGLFPSNFVTEHATE